MANKAGRFYTTVGAPTLAPPTDYRAPDVSIDTNTSKVYSWANNVWTEQKNFFGVSGKSVSSCAIDGSGNLIITYSDVTTQNVGKVVGATPILQTGNTTTLPFGSPALLSLRTTAPNTYAVDAAIPAGKDGSGGGTSVTFQCITPEQYYTNNWAIAVQTAITNACNTGAPLYTQKGYDCGSTVLNLPKNFSELTWKGNRAQIDCGGITRPRPTTLSESQLQQNTKFNIYDLTINGKGTGIGFEPAASSNSIFSNITIYNFATAGYFRTTQNGCIWQWQIEKCTNGIIRDCESGNGIDPSKAQSNDTKCWFTRMHVPDNFNMNICFGVYGSFGCDTIAPEVEGNAKVYRVLEMDDLGNTTVQENYFYKPHFEFTQGFQPNGALAYVKMRTGVFKLIAANHDVGAQANMILLEATSSANSLRVIIEDTDKWEHQGAIFKQKGCRINLMRGNSVIQFSPNNNPTVDTNIRALFTTTGGYILPTSSATNYNNDPRVWGYDSYGWSMF